MTEAGSHPWAETPESAEAARKAVQIPLNIMPGLASTVARADLEAKALEILAECALPPRDQPAHQGAVTPAYVGSMWSWPEADRARYAAREIGYGLMNWLILSHKPL